MMRAINEAIAEEPFVPFEIVMSSGDRFTVNNPDLLMLLGLHLRYHLPRKDGHVDLQISHIAFIRVGEASAER